jgi:hypothetical protein
MKKEYNKMMLLNRFIGYIVAVAIGCAITLYILNDEPDDMLKFNPDKIQNDRLEEL